MSPPVVNILVNPLVQFALDSEGFVVVDGVIPLDQLLHLDVQHILVLESHPLFVDVLELQVFSHSRKMLARQTSLYLIKNVFRFVLNGQVLTFL